MWNISSPSVCLSTGEEGVTEELRGSKIRMCKKKIKKKLKERKIKKDKERVPTPVQKSIE